MGWKTSIIVINSDKEIKDTDLLTNLGYNNLQEIESKYFEEIMNPYGNEVYIGEYAGNIIICEEKLPLKSIEEEPSKAEKQLSLLFPNTEICTLILHSIVNLWAYSITKSSTKIRVRAGSSDEGTFLEYGKPVKEEEELLSKATLDEKGKKIYYFEDFPDEGFTEDQVGENFVFDISKRYFGEQLDMADNLLFETKFKGYKFNKKVTKKSNFKIPIYAWAILGYIIWKIISRTFLK